MRAQAVWMAGAVGTDGRFLLDELAAAGVHTELVRVLETVRTGNAIIQNDKTGDNCILLYGGANRAITEQQVEQTLAAFTAGDWLLLQNEINGLPYLMRQAQARGLRIACNPSPMEARVLELPLETVDLFLLNRVEAAQLAGTDGADEDALLRALRARFPGAAVVLTLGAQGAVYMDGGQTVRQAAFPAQAVDTTAAGDTFTGFFLAARLRGESAAQAMARGRARCGVQRHAPGRGAVHSDARAGGSLWRLTGGDRQGADLCGGCPFCCVRLALNSKAGRHIKRRPARRREKKEYTAARRSA